MGNDDDNADGDDNVDAMSVPPSAAAIAPTPTLHAAAIIALHT